MQVDISPERGTAKVSGVSLSPFTGYQHGHLDVLAAARASGFIRRLAFAHGWLQPAEETDETTIFFVACDTTLQGDSGFISTRVMYSGEMFVTHVGNSSFSLYVTLFDGDEGTKPRCTMRLTYVCVSKANRRPVAIPQAKRLLLEASATNATAVRDALGAGAPAKLGVSDSIATLLLASGSVDCVDVAHRRRFELRECDFDFNMHLNQSMYQSFAIDSLKQACRDNATFAWVLATVEGAAPLHADLAVRGLRIDYKQEIPLLANEVVVTVVSDISASLVWFSVSASGDAPFLAAIGTLSIRTA
jgi:acyl-CoA thioesterase FadM